MTIKVISFLPIVLFFSLFLLNLLPPFDGDLFWHLRCGKEMVLLNKLCTPDTFSYTMPGHSWVYHGWTYEILVYVVHSAAGFWGLSIVGSLLLLSGMFFAYRTIQGSLFVKLLAIIAITWGIWHSISGGLRAQYFSFVWFSLLLHIILKPRKTIDYFLIPGIFLLWVNTHGAFVIGLVLLITYFSSEIIGTRNHLIKTSIQMFLCVLASIALTFVNPFGIEAYVEIVRQINAKMWYMGEYQHPTLFQLLPMLLITTIILILSFIKRKHRLRNSSMLIPLLILSYTAQRNILFFYPAAIILLYITIRKSKFFIQLGAKKADSFSILGILLIFGISLYRIPNIHKFNTNWFQYCANVYPCSALNYLQRNHLNGNMFTDFGWSGFFEWYLPESKLFFDDRMFYWLDQNNEAMFYTYNRVFLGSPKALLILDKSNTQIITTGNGKQLDGYLRRFPSGWKETYRDNLAVIYTK